AIGEFKKIWSPSSSFLKQQTQTEGGQSHQGETNSSGDVKLLKGRLGYPTAQLPITQPPSQARVPCPLMRNSSRRKAASPISAVNGLKTEPTYKSVSAFTPHLHLRSGREATRRNINVDERLRDFQLN
ncbi:hypothetical protein Csa_018530, partial [Cucumis sativus]